MKLIVGLGNPGKEYENTRHNIGFKCIDYLVKNLNLNSPKTKFNAIIYEYIFNNEKYFFVKPLSYMNLSGDPVISIATYFNIKTQDIIIIYDDKDLEFLKIKIKNNGSAGSHNGMKDIINKFKTENIFRIKIGIGHDKNYLLKDWVLSNFNKQELKDLNIVYNNLDLIFNKIFNNKKIDNILNLINKK